MMDAETQPCPACGAAVPTPKNNRRKCPSCKVWLGYVYVADGPERRVMLADAARLVKQEREFARHRDWVSAEVVSALEQFGFTAADVLRSIARHPTWQVERVAMRLLHSVAFSMPIGSDSRRAAMLQLSSWALACNEPANVYQREFFREDCLMWARSGHVAAVHTGLGAPGVVDQDCIDRSKKVTPIADAIRAPPLPCEKPYCYCWISAVFLDEVDALTPPSSESTEKQLRVIDGTPAERPPGAPPMDFIGFYRRRWTAIAVSAVVIGVAALVHACSA